MQAAGARGQLSFPRSHLITRTFPATSPSGSSPISARTRNSRCRNSNKYRAETTSVGQEWQDYFAYVLSLPEPEGNTETAAFLRQPVTVVEVTQGPLNWEVEPPTVWF